MQKIYDQNGPEAPASEIFAAMTFSPCNALDYMLSWVKTSHFICNLILLFKTIRQERTKQSKELNSVPIKQENNRE